MSFDKSTWDFNDPAGSEARFRAAAASADPATVVVLQTQIARTFGLRREFDQARAILASCEAERDAAGPEATARWWLEWGRTLDSPAHAADQVTDDAREQARRAYEAAFAVAEPAGLGDLAVDALHMLAIIEPAPADQLAANLRALAYLRASDDRGARSWEASVLNNVGMAHHDLGDLPAALAAFEEALTIRRAVGVVGNERVARWMVAWTLRLLGRHEEALAIQEALEREFDAAGEPDPYVFEELEALYTALGRDEDAGRMKARREG